MRPSHWLRANKGSPLPHNVVWVDTETLPRRVSRDTVAHALRFGWACYQRTYDRGAWTKPDWFRFTSARRFWSWTLARTRNHTRVFLFAHNWSFDAPVLDTFNILKELGWSLTTAVIQSPPVILVWRKEGKTLEMLDTLNFWRVPLARLGDSIGLPKGTMPSIRAGRRVWDRYARNDVEVIRRATHHWFDFLKEHDLGGFARTLAGQAMRVFRHRFLDHPLLIDDNVSALKLARDAYHGGRVECFRIGKVEGPIYCLDVNSMYPFIMSSQSFPSVFKTYTRHLTLADLRKWVARRCVVARVRVETKEPRYAVVRDDRLLFPVGRFEVALTTPELSVALKAGHIHSVSEAAIYDRAPLFKRFVEELYALRRTLADQGNVVYVYLLKLILNSLYGKFGQKGGNWQTAGTTDSPVISSFVDIDADTGKRRSVRQFAGVIQTRDSEVEAYSSSPAIAAHVTAGARAYLFDLITRAKRSNVVYCDTDSLYLTADGYHRLRRTIDSAVLGALKLEGVHAWIRIHGPKDYETPTHCVCKGVRANAHWLAPNQVAQDRWQTLVGQVATGNLSAPTTTRITKVLRRVYDKGRVSTSGAVSPFLLRDW